MSETKGEPGDPGRQRRYAPDEVLLLYQIRRSTGWIAFFSLVIAVGLAAAAYFLWQQLGAVQDELDQMGDQSVQIQKQAAISEKAIEDFSELVRQSIEAINKQAIASQQAANAATKELVERNRPWVGIESVAAPSLAANQNFSLKVVIRNSGNSPALNVRAMLYTAVPATKEITIPEIAECENCLQPVILPHGVLNYNVAVNGDLLTTEKTNRIKDGTDTILLLGRIDYADAATTTHTTTVCMSYVPKSALFGACSRGNDLN
jgi:flagellar hook-basal body complex protein FliE